MCLFKQDRSKLSGTTMDNLDSLRSRLQCNICFIISAMSISLALQNFASDSMTPKIPKTTDKAFPILGKSLQIPGIPCLFLALIHE
jgi:hypothetical protein